MGQIISPPVTSRSWGKGVHTIGVERTGHGVVNVAPVVLGIMLTADGIGRGHFDMSSDHASSGQSGKDSLDEHFVAVVLED